MSAEAEFVVQVRIPSRLLTKLADLADAHDMRINDFLLELGIQALHRRAPDISNPVVSRWADGWTDRQIAADLGMTNAAVAAQRRKFNLFANSNRSAPYRERNRAS